MDTESPSTRDRLNQVSFYPGSKFDGGMCVGTASVHHMSNFTEFIFRPRIAGLRSRTHLPHFESASPVTPCSPRAPARSSPSVFCTPCSNLPDRPCASLGRVPPRAGDRSQGGTGYSRIGTMPAEALPPTRTVDVGFTKRRNRTRPTQSPICVAKNTVSLTVPVQHPHYILAM